MSHTSSSAPPARARRALAMLACFLLALLGLTSTAVPASAYSSSQITAQYWWPHNGCSTITGDAPSGVSFTYACNHHDGCYWGHWADKGTCDRWFYNDMLAACGGGWYCNWWAGAYYRAVQLFGAPYYACRCDPNFAQYFA